MKQGLRSPLSGLINPFGRTQWGKATLTIESVGTQDGEGDLPITYVIDKTSTVSFWLYPAAEDDPTTVAELSSAPFVSQGSVVLTPENDTINLDIVGTLSGSVKGVALVSGGGNNDLVIFGPFTLASAAITATYVTAVDNDSTPNFGTLSAGWYAVCLMLRGEGLTTLTPPGQSPVSPAVSVTGSQTTNRSTAAIFLVELTAERSGDWSFAATSDIGRAASIYSLSGVPATPAVGETATYNTVVGSLTTVALSANTSAGSSVIACHHIHDSTTIADDATDLVTRDFYSEAQVNNRPASFSGVAIGGTPEADLLKVGVPGFRAVAAVVLALKPA